jgi:hypothetical protein
MSAFAICPAVRLSDGHSITSSAEAADIVRRHATDHCSLIASILCRRLEQVESSDEAQCLALDFRAWAAREGLLLSPPPRTPIAARPSLHR